MSSGPSFRVKLVAISAGVAASFGGWIALSDVAIEEPAPVQTASAAAALPISGAEVAPSLGEVDIPEIDLPAYESAVFGMQEALQSMGDVLRHAVTLDVGGDSGPEQKSSSREMVRNVGGAKFVSIR